MAQAPRPQQVTPADELRDLLSIVEKEVASIRHSGAAAVALLEHLDRIDALWPELEAAGVDLRPEAGRWGTVQLAVARHARLLLEELKPGGGIAALRAQRRPDGTAAAWWHLDAQVAQEDKRRLLRSGRIAAVLLVAGLAVYFALRFFFPVDPDVQAALELQNAADRKIQQDGDFAGALEDFKAATAHRPQDAELWLQLGVAQQKLGNTADIAESYRQARALLGSDLAFILGRSQVFLSFGMLDEAQTGIEEALALAPDNPYVFYLAASVYEAKGMVTEAISALGQCSSLAEKQDDTELMALSRYRSAMLLQQWGAQQAAPPLPTATPAS